MKILSHVVALAITALAFLAAPVREAHAQKIEVWTFIGPGEANTREKTVAHVIQSFKAKNPGIEVAVQVIPWQQLSPMLLRAAKAGQVPDVAMLYSPSMPGHIAAGTLTPLKSYVDAWPADVRADLVKLPETMDRAGITYGIPWDMRVAGLVYRADLLKAAGKRPPQTMQEWAETATAVSTPEVVGLALGFGQNAPSTAGGWFLATLRGSGVKVLDENGKAAFATPEAERVVQWVKDLVKKGNTYPQSVALQGLESMEQLFIARKAAFVATSTVKFELMATQSKLGDNVKMTGHPGWDAARPTPALVQSWSLVIPKGAKQPAAAWKFIEHWTSTAVQVESAKINGYIPVRSSALKDPWFKEPRAEMIRWAVDHAQKNPLAFHFPENTDALFDTWAKMFGQVLTDRMSPAEALKWAEAEYNRRGSR
jgi:ABC-type glycerol-3-phosphate transport system substrate-binding protein